MASIRFPTIAVVALVVVLGACSAPIHKVDDVGYGWGPQKGVTLAQVQSTVESTAKREGWQVSDAKAGSFTASREWDRNKHNIVVGVLYDLKTFSIRYKNSKQLGFNGTRIHNSYNRMVERLEGAIKENVSKLTP